MARLPQKKTSAKKKKKRTEGANTVAVPNRAETSEAEPLPKAGKESAAKKKPGPLAKKTTAVPKAAVAAREKNFLQNAVQFLREVKTELKKVTWPSRKQTLGSTLVVMVLVLIIAFFLGAVDIGLSSLVKMVLQ